jgi:hypothetical protein
MRLKIFDPIIFKQICTESNSMAQAASKLDMHFNTFRRYAIKLKVYKPNQAGKGISKNRSNTSIPLCDILEGKYPQYQTFKLKKRLILNGIKKNKCEECNLESWKGLTLNCELEHIDGNRTNHRLENLKMLCPNCHSQTGTFRGRNKKNC